MTFSNKDKETSLGKTGSLFGMHFLNKENNRNAEDILKLTEHQRVNIIQEHSKRKIQGQTKLTKY